MRLELAERLRCPRPHAPTPLIVVAGRVEDRDLLTGFAGCPVCHLEARFENGALILPPEAPRGAPARAEVAPAEPWTIDDERVERTMALLGLADPGGAILLAGRYVALGPALVVRCDVSVFSPNGADAAVPFTDGTFRAAALDGPLPPALVESALRTISIGGRVLGTAELPCPEDVKELARDSLEWVGERQGSGPLVSLRRG